MAVDYLREEWKVLDDRIAVDLKMLDGIGQGDFGVNARTLDDRTWIVVYSAAEEPATYYRFDRGDSSKLTKLFSGRPALEGKPLVPQWPLEIKSRDGLLMTGYLTLPKHADPNADGKPDKPVPLVLYVHGGPWGRDYYGYDGDLPVAGQSRLRACCRSTTAARPASARSSSTPATASGPARCTTT